MGERQSRESYSYRQGHRAIRRRTVGYWISAANEQRKSVAVIDIRNNDRYPWSNKYRFPLEIWDIYRITAIIVSAYYTAVGFAAFFNR